MYYNNFVKFNLWPVYDVITEVAAVGNYEYFNT